MEIDCQGVSGPKFHFKKLESKKLINATQFHFLHTIKPSKFQGEEKNVSKQLLKIKSNK